MPPSVTTLTHNASTLFHLVWWANVLHALPQTQSTTQSKCRKIPVSHIIPWFGHLQATNEIDGERHGHAVWRRILATFCFSSLFWWLLYQPGMPSSLAFPCLGLCPPNPLLFALVTGETTPLTMALWSSRSSSILFHVIFICLD